MSALGLEWQEILKDEIRDPEFQELLKFVKQERGESTIYPPPNQVFSAFRETPFNQVKVVILGQDPYHGKGQAHGMSFSVPPGVTVPPSLRNIYKELESDVGCKVPGHGYLVSWARQGVLLLNNVLTVRAHQAGSHQGRGWEKFTGQVIQKLSERGQTVFILWGRAAQSVAWVINTERNLVIESPHPSPYSAHTGFFGSRPFSRTNTQLREWGSPEINWQLPEVS